MPTTNTRTICDLAIGCTDVAGETLAVTDSIHHQLDALGALRSTVSSLQGDQATIAGAADLTTSLSETMLTSLLQSNETVTLSIAEFAKLTALIAKLGTRMVRFNEALAKVGDVIGVIDGIASTTRTLALNAAIEAARAGETGRAFAVVAAEVKRLSQDTSTATQTVRGTVADLTAEASAFVSGIEEGVRYGALAEARFDTISEATKEAAGLVRQVREQATDVSSLSVTTRASMDDVTSSLDGLAAAMQDHATGIERTRAKIIGMEALANRAFNESVQSDVLTEDHALIELARRERDAFVLVTQAALDRGELTPEELFDVDYRLILNSAPERFTTRLNAYADRHWAPRLERFVAASPNILSAACTDINGYLPTCTSEYNRRPTGNYDHDDKWCRHGRILLDDLDRAAKASDAPFFLYVYRRTAGNGDYQVARNIAVPIVIKGRRWGDFECSYVCSGAP